MRRVLTTALVALSCWALAVAGASGHAVPVDSTPATDQLLDASPPVVNITFNEPVQLLRGEDLEVVDSSGAPVVAGPGRVTDDRRIIEVPLRPDLPPDTYTVRYQIIGADSHVIPGLFVFGVGVDALAPPVLGVGAGGPAESGVWGVSARFLTMVTLGGLFGLIVFRWVVWRPAVRRASGIDDEERSALVTWYRDTHWMIFGVLALAAMLAQGAALVIQSARILGVGVLEAARDTSGITMVLGQTDFGAGAQLRGALLFLLFAAGAVQFMREYGTGATPKRATVAGGPYAALIMGGLVLVVLGSIAAQGHARVGAFPWAQVGAQLTHVAFSAVWVAGLALVILVFVRAPRVATEGGRTLAGHALLAFSALATLSVAVIFASGLARSITELGDPAELWQTAYGRSILIKIVLLVPLFAVAFYNRRIVAALRRVDRPNRATIARVQRTVSAELGLALAIVLVATLLVSQSPGA